MIRGLIWLAFVGGFILLGATVPLGKRTLFGHVSAIWSTKEAGEMREGIGEKAGPAVERLKRGVAAGVEAAKEPATGSGSGAGSAAPLDARPASR